MCLFFFFEQKTAYGMRISDWSSVVCSSDLWMILCAAMVAAIVVAAAAYLVAEPRYLATAQVALERTAEQVIDVDSVTPTADPDSAAVDTEVQALRSPELIGRVVDRQIGRAHV